MARPNPDILLKGHLDKLNYRQRDLVTRDVRAVLQKYKLLIPKRDIYTFNNGYQGELIYLDGTIPVPFKGQTYNIPVRFWLLPEHPIKAPICYVTPTQDMIIKPSQHVDSNGKIYLPYLSEWDYPSSDFLGLIEMCIITFSDLPPVYKRPAHSQPAHNALPYPTGGGYPGYPPQPAGYPPQPPSQHPAYQPNPGYAIPNYPGSSSGYPPPPAPGYSGGGGGYPGPQGGYQYPPGPAGYSPRPGGQPPAKPPPPYGYNPGGSNPYQPPTTNSGPGGYPPTSNEAPSFSSQTSQESNSSIGQEHIKASILSAVEDKVRRKMYEEFATIKAQMDSLNKVGDDLANGRNKIEEMDRADKQIDEDIQSLETNLQELAEAGEQMEEAFNDLGVDDAVMASAPLYSQLLSAYAEDCALEDVMYVLAKALNRGVLDLDTYLKQVRHLSRKQFMLRATTVMCREKAGLQV